ncbi:MAG: hemolysin family protein [Weeksellaceae bacterium]|nr:hemolysin family protein [Weeksellaceae bacterium]
MEFSFLIIILSLAAMAFFSGMEIAFFSYNRMYLELEKKKDTWDSAIISFLTRKKRGFITTMMIGNFIALVIFSVVMSDWLLSLFPLTMGQTTSFLLQTLITSFFVVILGEVIPKSLFGIFANKAFKIFAIPAAIFYVLLSVISTLVIGFTNLIMRMLGKKRPTEEDVFLRDELKYYIQDQISEAAEDEVDTEVQIFNNALEFPEVKARESMVPRKEIIAVDISTAIDEVRARFTETGFSKIIVYKENIDNILGYVHAFDMFRKPRSLRQVLLPVEFVNETTSAKDIMHMLFRKRKSVAVVLDEYGGTSGLITVEDVVEELFGDIEDEHDQAKFLEWQVNENEFVFSARLEVDYVNENYELDLPENDLYDTLGGMIVTHLERIPEVNEEIQINGYIFIVEAVSGSKVEEIRILKQSDL